MPYYFILYAVGVGGKTMKILILNGSPRLNGNTSFALSAIAEGVSKNTQHCVEIINAAKLKVGGCTACDACKTNGGNCIMRDDSRSVIDKIYAADAVIFGTPVYWWGISAQLKAVLDKFYSKTAQFKEQNKKIGVIAIGASAFPSKQYELIHDQFKCVCDFLGWEMMFGLSFSAAAPDDLKKSEAAVKEISEVWKKF